MKVRHKIILHLAWICLLPAVNCAAATRHVVSTEAMAAGSLSNAVAGIAVSGVVFSDRNHNGQQDSGENGITNVAV